MSPLELRLLAMKYSFKHPAVRLGSVVCLFAAIAMVITAFLWWPAYRVHQQVTQQIVAAQLGLKGARQAQELAQVYATALHNVPLMEQKMKTAINQTQIVDGLDRLARQSNILIVNQSYTERHGQSKGDLAIELAVEGQYEALRNFLHGLHSLPIWIELQEVQLAQTGKKNLLKGKLRIISFRRPVSVASGDA